MGKRDKIVFLGQNLNAGGAERQMTALAKGLHEKGHPVSVAVFYPGGPFEKALREAGVPLVALNKRGRWDIFGFLKRAITLLKKERPDVIHSYLVVPNIAAVLLKPFLRGVRIVWGMRASNMDLSFYDGLSVLSYRMEKWLSSFPELIIVNSRAGFEHAVSQGYPAGKMSLIPNGIDTDMFRPDKTSRPLTRASWRAEGYSRLIGLVGRLDPMKGHPTFIRAAALLSGKRPDIAFVCVGEGPDGYRSDLLKLSEELGLGNRLIWAGAHDDMPSVYRALDVVVSSSAYGEGFPNVIGEAMACGVPCVVTDVGDSAAVVGDTGIVVPSNDPHALAEACGRMLTALEERGAELAEKARSRIVDHYSLQYLIQRTSEALSGPA